MTTADPWTHLAGTFPLAGMHRLLDARIERSDGGVIVDATLDERFESIPGRAHGGAVTSLLDTAATWAVIAGTGRFFTTVDLRTDFLRPATLGAVRAVGEMLAGGSSLARARASLFDSQGRLCAIATGTFAPVGAPAAGTEKP